MIIPDPALFGVLTAAADEIASVPRCPECGAELVWRRTNATWNCPECGAAWKDVSP